MFTQIGRDLKPFLVFYRLQEELSTQQALIERAEEDLLCAVSLYRRGACGYSPFVTVCFLTHQALEKWLKAFIAVEGIPVSAKQHDLYSRLVIVEKVLPAVETVRNSIEEVDPEILGHKFPGDLRYNETPADVERYVKLLIKAAFSVRRLVKQFLKRKVKEGSYESS